jgi:hypothetical protein
MIRLLVTLDAPQPDHCGFCAMLSRPTGVCALFAEPLAPRESWGFLRCEVCKSAEDDATLAELAVPLASPEVSHQRDAAADEEKRQPGADDDSSDARERALDAQPMSVRR